jgi:uncharacterized membrane protein YphA (DoxX/SURF4 family)
MGIIFKARGGANTGLFIIRMVVGFLFLLAGAEKLMDIEGFINSVKAMGVMSDNLAFILGFILPFAQIFLGGLLIIGLFTPVVSFLLSLMTLSIIFATGAGDPVHAFSLNWVVLACTLCTLFSGAGVISFDAFFDKKKENSVLYSNAYISPEPQRTVTYKQEPVKEESFEVKEDTKEEIKETDNGKGIHINIETKKDINERKE